MGVAASGARDTNAFAGAAARGTRLPTEDSITYQGVFNENTYELDPAVPDKLISTEAHYARSLNPMTGTLETWIGCFIKSNRDGAPRDDTPIDFAIALDISESMVVGMGLGKASLFEQRLFRENAASGLVQFSLIWNTRDDLDLHCIAPGGEEISYQNRDSACGGHLDVDMNAGGDSSQEPVENIFWPLNPPTGRFKVFVENYTYKQTEGGKPVPFTLRLKFPNQEFFFEGECPGGSESEHQDRRISFSFGYQGPDELMNVESIVFGQGLVRKGCAAESVTHPPVHLADLRLYTGQESRLLYAKQCIEKVMAKLRPNDRIGIASFTETSNTIQPLQLVSDIDQCRALSLVNALQPTGGTTLNAGMTAAASMFQDAAKMGNRHKRILLITDMDDMNADELDKLVKAEAKRNVYCSIVGLGVDFNSKLAEKVSKNRGANYFTVTTPEELEKSVVTDFAWTFFPCAFDMDLDVMTQNLALTRVYGTPFDTADSVPSARWKPTLHQFYPHDVKQCTRSLLLCLNRQRVRLPMTALASIMNSLVVPGSKVTEINTMFPSAADLDGRMEGGLVLMRLSAQPHMSESAARLAVTYTNPTTERVEVATQCVQMATDHCGEHYSHECMVQAVLLQQYVETCKGFLQMADNLDWKVPVPEEEVEKLQKFKQVLDLKTGAVAPKVVETYTNFLKTTDKFIKDQSEAAAQAKEIPSGHPADAQRLESLHEGYPEGSAQQGMTAPAGNDSPQ